MAAFISNCGPTYRLEYLKKLKDYGVTVDGYGACLDNKQTDVRISFSISLLFKRNHKQQVVTHQSKN
jgi:hypothetical protein